VKLSKPEGLRYFTEPRSQIVFYHYWQISKKCQEKRSGKRWTEPRSTCYSPRRYYI